MTEVDLKSLEIWGFCDPASGKQRQALRKVRARQALVFIGVDYLLRIFVLYAWGGRLVASKFRDHIIEQYERWQPRRLGIEDNGLQSLFGDLVLDQARQTLKGNIRIVGVPTSTKVEKDFKIRTALEPLLAAGRLFIPPTAYELLAEIQGFPTWHLKDLVDCLAMAVMLIPRRPQAQQQTTEKAALLRYLRDSGAPAGMIDSYAATGKLDRSYGAASRIEGATAWQELLQLSRAA